MKLNEVKRYRSVISAEAQNLTDEQALIVPMMFDRWQSGVQYEVGNRIYYNDTLYKALLSHLSQDDWTPDIAPSLWVRVDSPHEEWPEWIQPVGSADAYPIGAKVSHNECHWVSLVDANVWEPSESVPTLWKLYV